MKLFLVTTFVLFLFTVSGQIPNTLSPAEKVFGLSKFWQEVNYNFIYLNKVDKLKWQNEYIKNIADVQNTKDDYEYYRLLQKFCALLNDGHTNVFLPKIISDSIYQSNFGDYKIFLTNIEGKAIVTRVNSSKKNEIPIGTEVTKVNGIPTATYLAENVKPYISSSTDYILDDLGVSRLLSGYVGSKFNLELRLPNNTLKTLPLTHSKTNETEVYPAFEERNLMDFKWLPNGIAYVALNSFDNPKIDTLFIQKLSELYKAKKLIIDLRNNGGGDSEIGLVILQYLTNDTVMYRAKSQSRLHIPAYKAWGKWTSGKDTINNSFARQAFLSYRDEYYYQFPYQPDPLDKSIKRKIVVPTTLLIGHNTASAAEDFLIFADNQKHMTKIGERTFGSTGQPMMFDLPGGGSARICTKKDTYPDGREFVGYGIKPDIEVKQTLKSYIDQTDPVLEKAVDFLMHRK